MWRKLGIWAAPSAVAILVVGCGTLVADVHRHEAVQRAHEAEGRAAVATVEREQGKTIAVLASAKAADDAQVGALMASLEAANAEKSQLAAENASLKEQAASGGGFGGGAPTAAGPPVSNHFPYGQCTYYVATRRNVPWNGNAIAWLWNAAPFRPEGSTPRPGAIMVTSEGWGLGHVAYVESVGAGSFTVSEMNFAGWGFVDYRTIRPGTVPILGFIY